MSSVGRVLGERVMLGKAGAAFPVVRTDLVDINSVTDGHREHLNSMKLIFSMKGKENFVLLPPTVLEPKVRKYFASLFFLAPYYHLAFPHIDKMIVLDLDLEFR